jgi:ParB-like chromosome segregation protein Spo0J
MSDPTFSSVPGTLEHVDPHALVIGDNVRDDAALDAEFIASIREHGVLQPTHGDPYRRRHPGS